MKTKKQLFDEIWEMVPVVRSPEEWNGDSELLAKDLIENPSDGVFKVTDGIYKYVKAKHVVVIAMGEKVVCSTPIRVEDERYLQPPYGLEGLLDIKEFVAQQLVQ